MSLGIQQLSKLGNIGAIGSITQAEQSSVFDEIYKSAIGLIDETNQLQKNADQMSVDFALGKIDNVHDVMIAQEKASIALQYTVQIREAVLNAYNEIMRLQL